MCIDFNPALSYNLAMSKSNVIEIEVGDKRVKVNLCDNENIRDALTLIKKEILKLKSQKSNLFSADDYELSGVKIGLIDAKIELLQKTIYLISPYLGDELNEE